ncbi:MAG TPA: RNase adapter RapZ [Acidimicrobiia bacterium]
MEKATIDVPRVLVVTGMSGAGRSSAAKVIEDLGYVVIDNLPPKLLADAVKAHDIPEQNKQLAVVIDSRGGLPIEELSAAVFELARDGVQSKIVFLDADDDVIVRRYEENRRPHPLGEPTISAAIEAERILLADLRTVADYYIDTSTMNVHQLRAQLNSLFADEERTNPMRVSIRSFGFKHGAPRDIDLLFDVRFLPNPHWVDELRDQRGTDGPVSEYVLGDESAREFVDKLEEMLLFLVPRFESEGKSYLSVGIGCTGGHHRSVAIAEELGKRLNSHDVRAAVRHRDIET